MIIIVKGEARNELGVVFYNFLAAVCYPLYFKEKTQTDKKIKNEKKKGAQSHEL